MLAYKVHIAIIKRTLGVKMLYKTALKKMCKSCQFVRRKQVLRVICKENPRHKQTQKYTY